MEYDIIDLDGRGLLEYESCIRQVLEADCIALGENGGLAAYIHSPALREKIKSIQVDIAVDKGRLCGCAEIDYTAEPSEREWNNLLDYLSGQYSDGWGEGFEQRDIPVDGGTLNVHFWQSDAFEPVVLDTSPGIQPQKASAQSKPRMNLVGEDGNIFAIMGRAAHLLSEAGQRDQAHEMRARVMASDNYYKALGIISEYVETELSAKSPAKQNKERGDAR